MIKKYSLLSITPFALAQLLISLAERRIWHHVGEEPACGYMLECCARSAD